MNPNGFLLQAIKHPLSVGAVAPSSKSLSKLMMGNADLANAAGVAELGPGTGVFTHAILAKLPDSTPYIGIERNQNFVDALSESLPETKIVLGSAEQLSRLAAQHNIPVIDRVISSLPWVAFSAQMQDTILSEVGKILPNDGLFLTYDYFPFNLLPKGRAFLSKLKQHFEQVVKTEVVSNVPPALVYVCSKPRRRCI
jgi:phospholipid N-methyltransferase